MTENRISRSARKGKSSASGAEPNGSLSNGGESPSAADFATPSIAPPRRAEIDRKTRETTVAVELSLDGSGRGEIATGVPFLDHMLQSFARHGFFDLTVRAKRRR